MSSWKNVNNWHWVDKDCTSWAKNNISQRLENLVITTGPLVIRITKVDCIEGDVTVTLRKNRLFYFYDLEIKCCWATECPQKHKGTFTVSEFSDESQNPQSLVLDVVCSEDCHLDPSLISQAIFEQKQQFDHDLRISHGLDSSGNPVTKEKEHSPQNWKESPSGQVASTNLEQQVVFSNSPAELYSVLTNPDRMMMWTMGNFARRGEYFRIFGHVLFKFTRLVENQVVEMEWRYDSWPSHCGWSSVTITLEPRGTSTQVHLKQENVPSYDLGRLEENWKEYYWKSIKNVFGFGLDFA